MKHLLTSRARLLGGALLAVSLATGPTPVFADPPPWAPAHGWRKKHQHDDGPPVAYVAPYGLAQSTCNRDVIGGLIGGAAGGLVGSQFGKGDGRTAAIVGGVVIGALVGGSVGRAMDNVDQACVGQVLEHVPDRQAIAWRAPDSSYEVVPLRSWEQRGRHCREFETRARIDGRKQKVVGTACRTPDGAWRIVN